jgi:hypothetical protein
MVSYELPDLSVLGYDPGQSIGPEQDYLLRQVNSLLTQKQNLHGRRIGKAKDAINPGDYVTKRQLNGTLVGTLAQRPQPSNVVVGTTYFATDRNVTYIARGGHWYYYDGIQDVTLSPDTKPSPSVLYDNGYMIYATDFDWYYRWNLITWKRLGGANLYVEGFWVAPTKPGWGIVDGSTYTYSTDNASVVTGFTPNDVRGRFLKYGATTTPVVANAPTISGNTGNESVKHTHTTTSTGTVGGTVHLPSLTHSHTYHSSTGVLSAPHGHSVDVSGLSVSGTTGGPSGTTPRLEGSASVASDSHTHGFSASISGSSNTGTEDATHTHSFEDTTDDAVGGDVDLTLAATFTGSPAASGVDSVDHTHSGSSLTISNDGSPLAFQLIPYVRL